MENLSENRKEQIISYCSGNMTPGEIDELSRWVEASAEHRVLFKQVAESYHTVYLGAIHQTANALGTEVEHRVGAYIQRRKAIFRRRVVAGISSAAAVVVIIAYVLGVSGNSEKNPLTASSPILPGERKAILTLADGTERGMTHSELFIGREGEMMEVDSSGAARSGILNVGSQGKYHTLTIPRGGEYTITLPDSTQVWLNAETVLRFPDRFTADERKVYLSGEAYFHVTKKGETPFRVALSSGEITVYGTQFNVMEYAGSPLEAVLVEGSIGFTALSGKTTRLEPRHRLVYDTGKDYLAVEKVNTRRYISWKDNMFYRSEERRVGKECRSRWSPYH